MTRQAVEQWISELAAPNPKFGGQATCPFAQSAWREGHLEYEDCGRGQFRHGLLNRLYHVVYGFVGARKVHVLEFDPADYDVDLLAWIVERINAVHPHLLVLYIHPDDDEPSHPTLGLVLVQRRDDMMATIEVLRKTPYFDNNPLPEWYNDA
jgi:hypothetical protein